MKIALLLCALLFSAPAWCASGMPSERAARAATASRQATDNAETDRNLQKDMVKAVMIGWICISYLALITGWTVAAKRSLDDVLKGVLEDLGRYS